MAHYISCTQDTILIEYTIKDRSIIQKTCTYLEEAFTFLIEYFHTERFPLHVVVTPDRGEFDRCIKEILKIDIEVPSNPGRIGQPQKTDLIVLSPRVWEKYQYTPEFYKKVLFHEMTHIVEENLSPDIEKVTLWWSEGLAVYLSGQAELENEEKAKVKESIKREDIPTIKDMQTSPPALSYTWGWTIVKYIECHYGRNMVEKIVKECNDGDVFGIIGENLQEVEKKWKAWLLQEDL